MIDNVPFRRASPRRHVKLGPLWLRPERSWQQTLIWYGSLHSLAEQGNFGVTVESAAVVPAGAAWPAMFVLDGPARAWEPKRLQLRLFAAAGRLARDSRRLRLRLAATWPWADQLTAAITRLQAYAPG